MHIMTILVVEDEKLLVDILKKALKAEKYTVEAAYDGHEGLEKATKNSYDIILLDIMMPKMDGLSLCKELRARGIHTPIIMLTARGTEDDKVIGLNSGADDYLVKPFSMRELFARIIAVSRRRKTTESNIVTVADLVMDRVRHEVKRGDKIMELTPKEYKILDTLLSKKGEAISRDKLVDAVWGHGYKESNNELNVHMRYLRRKIEIKGKKPIIHTIRGTGFIIKE